MDEEMMRALEADGEKLAAMTGEDHGPVFVTGQREIDDGGPVHPCTIPTGLSHITEDHPGISLRAYLAVHWPVPPQGIPEAWAKALMRTPVADWMEESPTFCVAWWAEAEARYRVLHADAMIRVLNETATGEGA